MTFLTLNCPHCRRPLEYVPHAGLTLYYCCRDHGALILRPLLLLDSDDWQRLNQSSAASESSP